jgi:hypothetical protein
MPNFFMIFSSDETQLRRRPLDAETVVSARDRLHQRDNPASSASHALISRIVKSDRGFNLMPCSVQGILKTTSIIQRLPTRLTGPPRFIGVPRRTPTPAAPMPGVTTARATGRATSRTPGLTMQPAG